METCVLTLFSFVTLCDILDKFISLSEFQLFHLLKQK